MITTMRKPDENYFSVNNKECIVKGDILGGDSSFSDSTASFISKSKANDFISKEALYASISASSLNSGGLENSNKNYLQSDSSFDNGPYNTRPDIHGNSFSFEEKSRPSWGSGGLPQNFKMKKSTIASGPIPTSDTVHSYIPLEDSDSKSSKGIGTVSLKYRFLMIDYNIKLDSILLRTYTPTGAMDSKDSLFRQSSINNEFQDFMTRRSQLADRDLVNAENTSKTNFELNHSTSRTSFGSSSHSVHDDSKTVNKSLPHPVVKQIDVYGKQPSSVSLSSQPSQSSTKKSSEGSEVTKKSKPDLSIYAKPYDPNSESDVSESSEDEDHYNRKKYVKKNSKTSLASSKGKKYRSDDDDEDDEEQIGLMTSQAPIGLGGHGKFESSTSLIDSVSSAAIKPQAKENVERGNSSIQEDKKDVNEKKAENKPAKEKEVDTKPPPGALVMVENPTLVINPKMYKYVIKI
jgi:hypothetical protein